MVLSGGTRVPDRVPNVNLISSEESDSIIAIIRYFLIAGHIQYKEEEPPARCNEA